MAQRDLNKHRFSSQLSPAQAKQAGLVRSNMLLIGVFAAGTVCVYVLGLRELPQVTSGEQAPAQIRVETRLKSLGKSDPTSGVKPGEGMAVVDTFYHQAKHRQIPIKALLRNPFVSRSPRLLTPSVPKAATKREEAKSKSLKEAIERVKKLKLQSVLVGSGGTIAVISGHVVTVGQEIQGWTVIQIESRWVALSWREQRFVLRMSQ